MPQPAGPIKFADMYAGSEFTDVEWEFIRAMEKYQRRFRRR